MALDPYLSGEVADIQIVTVSISFERTLEENLYAYEVPVLVLLSYPLVTSLCSYRIKRISKGFHGTNPDRQRVSPITGSNVLKSEGYACRSYLDTYTLQSLNNG